MTEDGFIKHVGIIAMCVEMMDCVFLEEVCYDIIKSGRGNKIYYRSNDLVRNPSVEFSTLFLKGSLICFEPIWTFKIEAFKAI